MVSVFVKYSKCFVQKSNFLYYNQNALNENHDENGFLYFRTMESEKESMRQHLDETLEEKEDIMRQLSRANGDAALWRSK